MKSILLIAIFLFGTNFDCISSTSKPHDLYDFEEFLFVQTPFNFINPVPSKIRLMEKVDLSFYVNQSIVFQYRYKLEVPQGGEATINKSLLNWSGWINKDINDIIVPKLGKEGRYKLVVEYKTHTSSETNKYEKPFDVYSVKPVNYTVTAQSTTKVKQDDTTTKPTLPVADNKATEIPPVNYRSKDNNQYETVTNKDKEADISSVKETLEETKVGQDIIIKHNGEEIKSKVLEITPDLIKYIDYGRTDNQVRDINISDVSMIVYRNGTRELFSKPTEKKETETAAITGRAVPSAGDQNSNSVRFSASSIKQEKRQLRKYGNYFSVAAGAGNSYGGLGLSLQYLTQGRLKLGIHGGAGYFPLAGQAYLFTGGLKLYFWDYLYTDLQFGRFGAYQKTYYDYYNGYTYENGTLYGPSILMGYDWFFSDHFGINAAAGVSYDIGDYFKDFTYALDLGFVFRF